MSRELSIEEANKLGAGSDHYRAYVGPPKRYGTLALLQMSLLSALAIEETDKVLDFGCGSLRLGRSLIPFLHTGNYYGIDPNGWLMEEGFKYETGNDLRTVKHPKLSEDAAFDCGVFNERFDFIMAQSIITHAGADNTRKLIETAGRALVDDGIFVLSYLKGDEDTELTTKPWTYPFNVPYPESWLKGVCEENGLVWRELEWHHPGATWAAITRDARRLPAADAQLGLNGLASPRWRTS